MQKNFHQLARANRSIALQSLRLRRDAERSNDGKFLPLTNTVVDRLNLHCVKVKRHERMVAV